MRRAQIVACAVEVLCPHCGGSQPNPDNGAFSWLPDEVRREAAEQSDIAVRSCNVPWGSHQPKDHLEGALSDDEAVDDDE